MQCILLVFNIVMYWRTSSKIWCRFNTKLISRLSNKRHSRIEASLYKAVMKQDLSIPFVILCSIRNSVSGNVIKFFSDWAVPIGRLKGRYHAEAILNGLRVLSFPSLGYRPVIGWRGRAKGLGAVTSVRGLGKKTDLAQRKTWSLLFASETRCQRLENFEDWPDVQLRWFQSAEAYVLAAGPTIGMSVS